MPTLGLKSGRMGRASCRQKAFEPVDYIPSTDVFNSATARKSVTASEDLETP